MLKSKDRPMPAPTYMSDDQKAEYLRSLRTSTFNRPSGSRPAPPSKYTSAKRNETDAGSTQETGYSSLSARKSMPVMSATHSRASSTGSANPLPAHRPLAQQPSVPNLLPTSPTIEDQDPSILRKPSIPYLERGTRWMEKQEVASIRRALHDMDLETEEEQRRIHAAAQDEAAELVYRHQNPDGASAPYANPDVRRDYHSHLRKGSYARSHGSQDGKTIPRKVSGGSHDGSSGSENASITSNKRRSMDVFRKVSPPSATTEVTVQKRRVSSSGNKKYDALASAVADDIIQAHRRSSSGSRRILSGEKKRTYMHPDDRIWEDPQEEVSTPAFRPQMVRLPPPSETAAVPTMQQQPVHIRKNPFARVRMQAEKLERSRSEPIVSTNSSNSAATTVPTTTTPLPNRVEIHRNPPSQSRRPWYTSNVPLSPTSTPPSSSAQQPDSTAVAADDVPPKSPTPSRPSSEGKEIRSDDIRAATSKKRNDYSPKLPRPTIVSDKPGRPIVSFDPGWRPREVVLEGSQAAAFREPEKTRHQLHEARGGDEVLSPGRSSAGGSSIPRINVDAVDERPVPTVKSSAGPSIPTIVLPDDSDFADDTAAPSMPTIPAFNISSPPEINVQPPTIQVNNTVPPPTNRRSHQAPTSHRPPPTHAATSPLPMSRPHFTPTQTQSSTLCAHCALPIAGRILSASGARFHPACFTCHACHTNLELVAFYAEPEKAHSERLERIRARAAGEQVPGEEELTQEELMQQELLDGHADARFYCHLDYHELFSPRCKSCKTPIEGEVILACGAEWHAGHFFCAQCGDPFDSKTPFVEKDGYAWCVGCHTNRFSAKCRRCRKPVVDMVVKALGAEWHGGCFVCEECGGEFKDGRYFLRGISQDPVCVGCEERRLKS